MIVLASQSPRRKEILTRAGIPFVVRVSGIDEVPGLGESPAAYVQRLAQEKAAAVECSPEEFVLAADTTVVVDDELLEKPHSEADAIRMLTRLNGRDHLVLTGICLLHHGRTWSSVESTTVTFATMTDQEIQLYAASGEPFDKAGGYAIQGLASKFITRVEGCYLNVVGLPMAAVYAMLKRAGYSLALG
ncbi:Maf family protein [uncultured Paludibaculum sp.]|uniref:Maf family protein n=1 Tax=uncultured Paludibaculum sp. TaxID=1765020 RepID=UPI002AAAEB41|nr:Maf family protein [uncultured Paludibaculum sp.]